MQGRSLLLTVAVAGVLALALPAAVQAAPVLTLTNNVLSYSGMGGTSNNTDGLTVTTTTGTTTQYVPTGSNDKPWNASLGDPVLPAGCTQDGDHVVTCILAANPTRLQFSVFAGNDSVTATGTSIPVSFLGDTGIDFFSGGSGADVANGGDGPDILLGNGGDDQLNGEADADTLAGGEGNDTITGAGGSDTAQGGGGTDNFNLGPGRDLGVGGDGDDTLAGGDGADTLLGGANNDGLIGGNDRDEMVPGIGRDTVDGGDGFDLARYDDRTDPAKGVSVSLDGVANDGESGEGDDVAADVEDVVGGAGDDILVGSDRGNVLDGGPGADQLNGRGGVDQYVGGAGNDAIAARDGLRESISCGADSDSVVGDRIDEATDCEALDLSADLVSDADGDGVAKPADCNDASPAVRPGIAEIPDDGVDQNCDGADATDPDRDRDGSPRPADCDDRNPAVRPGADEVLGNSIDEDCNGLANPFPRITSTVTRGTFVFTAFTKISKLDVNDIPAGATVVMRCKGGGCPKKGVNRKFSARTKRLNLLPFIRKAKLKGGAKVEVRITKPQTAGKIVVISIRRRKTPVAETSCLYPGETKAKAC